MKRYVVGQDRSQSTLFPESLEDYIAEDSPVRSVDVFVDELDLLDLGFDGAEPRVTGRPAYHPGTLLKIYIYGYLNRIQSSRRLDRADQSPTPVSEARTEHLQHKVATIRAHLQELKHRGEQLAQSPDGQLSLTDPDARSMATSARGSGTVGYNVQVAVDAKHHLIVTHEVTNLGHDRTQLAAIGKQTQQALHVEKLTALADRGYYKSEEILECERAGITALVPKSQTSNNRAKGQFDRRDFRYHPEVNECQCPANQRAIWRVTTVEHGMTLHCYWTSACPRCPIKAQCTTADYRRITRWEHEAVLEAMQTRLEQMPQASRIRRQTVEHVFGTLKSWMRATHFLTKRFPNVSTEMSLHVLAYNLKRTMQILGVRPLMQLMRA